MTDTTLLHFLSYNTHLFLDTLPGTIDLATKWINKIIEDVPLINKVIEDVPRQKYEDSRRLDDIITKVQNLAPDIVGFSEVWANNSKKEFISRLESQLPFYAWDKKEWNELGSGLLLLSRFPLSNVSFTEYNRLSGIDSTSQKGFLMATAEIGSQKLLIVHTHTQAEDSNAAIEARKDNINQLHSSISSAADYSMPVILFGDLNITGENELGDSTDEYEFLRDTFKQSQMSDSYREMNDNAVSNPGYTYDAVNNKLIKYFDPSYAERKVKQRLDYMFMRGITPISVTVPDTFTFQTSDGTMDLSDHYPLQGYFELKQK